MKLKYLLVGMMCAIVLTLLGALLKILHLPGATELLYVGPILETVFLIGVIFKLLWSKRFKDFINQ